MAEKFKYQKQVKIDFLSKKSTSNKIFRFLEQEPVKLFMYFCREDYSKHFYRLDDADQEGYLKSCKYAYPVEDTRDDNNWLKIFVSQNLLFKQLEKLDLKDNVFDIRMVNNGRFKYPNFNVFEYDSRDNLSKKRRLQYISTFTDYRENIINVLVKKEPLFICLDENLVIKQHRTMFLDLDD